MGVSRYSSILRQVWVWIGVTATTAVSCEIFARLTCPLPEIRNFNRAEFTKSEVFGGLTDAGSTAGDQSAKMIRNVSINWVSDPDQVTSNLRLNLYGFRGPDFRVAKSPGVTRIAVIGDSFTEGFGAQQTETIPAVLQQRLDSRGRFEVLNFGIAANNLTEYLNLASVAVPIFRPDIVLVILCYNDLPAAELDVASITPKREPHFYRWWEPRIVEVISEVADHQYPALWFPRGPFQFFQPVPDPSNPLTTVAEEDTATVSPKVLAAMRAGRFNPYVMYGAPVVEASLLGSAGPFNPYLDRIREITEHQGGRMGFVYIPFNASVSDFYYPMWNETGARFNTGSLTDVRFTGHQRSLAEYSKSSGVPFVDLTPAIRGKEITGKHLYVGYDDHMNADGYALAADTILATLRDLFGSREEQV